MKSKRKVKIDRLPPKSAASTTNWATSSLGDSESYLGRSDVREQRRAPKSPVERVMNVVRTVTSHFCHHLYYRTYRIMKMSERYDDDGAETSLRSPRVYTNGSNRALSTISTPSKSLVSSQNSEQILTLADYTTEFPCGC